MEDLTIASGLREISPRLSDAAAVAKGALPAGGRLGARTLRMAMDLDELLHESATLHGAICLLGRAQRRGGSSRDAH